MTKVWFICFFLLCLVVLVSFLVGGYLIHPDRMLPDLSEDPHGYIKYQMPSANDAGATDQEKVTLIDSTGKKKWDGILYKNSKGIPMLEVTKNRSDEYMYFPYPQYDMGIIRSDGKWYLLGARSLESREDKISIEGVGLQLIKGSDSEALRAAIPNLTDEGQQGLPECKIPTSKMTQAEVVSFLKNNKLFGVITSGNAGKILEYSSPKMAERYNSLDKWPYTLHLVDGRDVKVFKSGSDGDLDGSWTHFMMPASIKGNIGIADHYAGLDTATYPGYILVVERYGALNTDFQDGAKYMDVHTAEYYRFEFNHFERGREVGIYPEAGEISGKLEGKPKYEMNKVMMVINTKSVIPIGGQKVSVSIGSFHLDGVVISEDTLDGYKLLRVEAKVPKGT